MLKEHKWPLLYLSLLAVVVFASFLSPQGLLYRVRNGDVVNFHLPNYQLARQSILEYHQYPLWTDPVLLAGGCFLDLNTPSGSKRHNLVWIEGRVFRFDHPSERIAVTSIKTEFEVRFAEMTKEAIREFEKLGPA